MQGPFETVAFAILAAALVLSFLPRTRFGLWAFRAAGLAFAALAADAIFGGGARWPLVPALTLSLLLLLFTYWRLSLSGAPNWRRRTVFGGYVVLASAAAILSIGLGHAFPVFVPPAPGGSYGIGVSDIYLKDQSRPELATDDPDDKRELMVRVWYPSDVPMGMPAEPLFRDPSVFATLFQGALPDAFFDYLKDVRGHGHLDTPLANAADGQPFPVLVYSHGFGSFGEQDALLMEELASHGFIVFSIEHTYQALHVRMPDGRKLLFNPKGYDNGNPAPDEVEDILARMREILAAKTLDDHRRRIGAFMDSQPSMSTGLDVWVKDTGFVIDQLSAASADGVFGRFAGQMDLSRLGVFGMSYGGAAAGYFCATDSRCKAGINMDGLQFGRDALSLQVDAPFMVMNSDHKLLFGMDADTPPFAYDMNDFYYEGATGPVYSLVVEDALHLNYSDLGFVTPAARWMGMQGPVDVGRMNSIMNRYITGFFARHLQAAPAPMLDNAGAGDPEVIAFKSRNTEGFGH